MPKAHCRRHSTYSSFCSACRRGDETARRKFGSSYSSRSDISDSSITGLGDVWGGGSSGGYDGGGGGGFSGGGDSGGSSGGCGGGG